MWKRNSNNRNYGDKIEKMVSASVRSAVECGDGTFKAAFVSSIVLPPRGRADADVSTEFFIQM